MNTSSASQPDKPGLGIDWSSGANRREFFLVAAAMSIAFFAICCLPIVLEVALDTEPWWKLALAGLVTLFALLAAFSILFHWYLKSRVTSNIELSHWLKVANAPDLKWFSIWLMIALSPSLVLTAAFSTESLSPTVFPLLLGVIVVAPDAGALVIAALRPPNSGPLPIPTVADEQLAARRTAKGMAIYAFGVMYLLWAMIAFVLIYLAVSTLAN